MEGKVVLVTGASSGIGADTGKHFASLNCKLALVARNAENLEKVKQKCGTEDQRKQLCQTSLACQSLKNSLHTLALLVHSCGIIVKHKLVLPLRHNLLQNIEIHTHKLGILGLWDALLSAELTLAHVHLWHLHHI